MDRKTLVKDVANKLRKIREPLGYSHREMGELLSAQRSSYTRYENGETFPKEVALYRLGEKFDISLDWLILDRGPKYYKEKEAIKEQKEPEPPANVKTLADDVLELVEVMEQVPILRYKVLLYFHELKKEHKEMIESSGKDKKENQ